MLQSMFAVTFTSNRDSRWLYETLAYLFENVEHLQDEAFGHQFVNFLEALAVRYAEGRLFAEDGQNLDATLICLSMLSILLIMSYGKIKIIYRSTF